MDVFETPGAELALKTIKLISATKFDNSMGEFSIQHVTYRWDRDLGRVVGTDPWFRVTADCSDLFAPGGADCEEVNEDNFDLLEKAIAELMGVDRGSHIDTLHLLYAAKCRNARPHPSYYRLLPGDVWHLFDACGPVRGQETL